MPKGKTRRFIDKKNSVTFHLVHRSQKDPLVADETAPQRVLVPAGDTQAAKIEKKSIDSEKRKEEQQKFGIYYDDDYDYLQHLRDVKSLSVEWQRVENTNVSKNSDDKDIPKINLPSSVFASNVEEEVGMLNKAAPVSGPQLHLDPDVVAAMDDDFDYNDPENQLEDNFIELANAGSSDDDGFNREYEYELNESDNDYDKSDISSEGYMEFSDEEDEEEEEVGSLKGPQYTFKDEETKSRFTEYSMSSSVMRRNDQLTLLDDKFEKLYAAYDENEIGALDCDEIEGYIAHDSDLVLQCAKEFEKKQKEDTENIAELMKERMKIIEKESSDSEDECDLEKLVVDAHERDKWDCESILSTYSNIYNHPKLIPEPKRLQKMIIDPKTGIPKNVLGNTSGKLTAETLSRFNFESNTLESKGVQSVAESRKSTLSILSVRPKGETSKERRERKRSLKEYRKERRIERKANTEAFKEEKKRQEKVRLNNRLFIRHGYHVL
ncbi:PREDICTED: protein LTV1 homolog [Dinoponera quadriceps]|uniref:Protein LTV1 homolog n=1 Tax=Dinoponera quadriceps TaxID=609295 RepID=A0A6P3XP63_DINQU|nr:PREDICTED: protein LTV1 homolog [Dinoponera quadriceps]